MTKNDKHKAIFARIVELRDQLEDFKWELNVLRDAYDVLGCERDAAIERAEKAERDLTLLIARVTDAEKQAGKYLLRVEKAEAELASAQIIVTAVRSECENLLGVLNQAKEIADEVVSILADDHDVEAGCLLNDVIGTEVGCLACLAQERLVDIKYLKIAHNSMGESTKEKETVHFPGNGTLIIRKTQQ